MWAKISNSATSMACAACIAAAATLPWAGTAAERLSDAAVRPAANPITQLNAFNAIPNYVKFLTTGDLGVNGLGGIAAFSAINPLLNGNPTALAAFSAIPNYANFFQNGDLGPTGLGGIAGFSAVGDLLNGNITALAAFNALPAYASGDLSKIAAFSAIPNWVNFLTHGDLSRATGLSGIAAFSALPAWNAVLRHGEIAALAPDQTPGAVGGIAAFSAVPGYLGIDPPTVAPDIPYVPPPRPAPLASTLADPSTAPTGGNTVNTFKLDLPKPPAAAPPVDPKVDPEVTTPDSGDSNLQNVQRTSQKFTPKSVGDNPFLFGSGNKGTDNGMPGWQKALNSAGIGAPAGGGAGAGTG